MTRLVEVFRATSKRPMESIEVIIAIAMVLAGLHLLSPWHEASPGSSVADAFASSVYGPIIYAIICYLVPAGPIILGLFWEKFNTVLWRTRATYLMFISLVFTSFLRVITIGFVPVSWLFSLGLGLISAVCYLYVRTRP